MKQFIKHLLGEVVRTSSSSALLVLARGGQLMVVEDYNRSLLMLLPDTASARSPQR